MLLAAATPLASIFGSGFLIIVPLLTRSIGPYAVVGMAVVCLTAWLVGNAIRHNVVRVEAPGRAGTLPAGVRRLEWASDATIIVAYVISVALYVRILAQFVVGYVEPGMAGAEHALAVGAIALITAVGAVRGLHGLDLLERVALAAVLLLVTAIVVAFAVDDLALLTGTGLELPPTPGNGLTDAALVLGGIVITVQGFETIRYLPHVAPATRVAASRVAQLVSTVVYLLLVALATPLMAQAVASGADDTLLELVELVAPALVLPLVLCAVLSQLSAAIADTEAGIGNIAALGWTTFTGRRAYLLLGVVAAALVATLDTYAIVVIASRAFAAYYALQCLVAGRTSRGAARCGYTVLALLMAAIAVLARPAT